MHVCVQSNRNHSQNVSISRITKALRACCAVYATSSRPRAIHPRRLRGGRPIRIRPRRHLSARVGSSVQLVDTLEVVRSRPNVLDGALRGVLDGVVVLLSQLTSA